MKKDVMKEVWKIVEAMKRCQEDDQCDGCPLADACTGGEFIQAPKTLLEKGAEVMEAAMAEIERLKAENDNGMNERRAKMKYNIKVGEKYLIGESVDKTLKGTVVGDTTAVYSRCVSEMSAYDFCDCVDDACAFDRVTACDYIRGIMERQNYGFYLGEIKIFDAEHEETMPLLC